MTLRKGCGLFLFYMTALVKLDGVSAPQPFMHRDAAAVFQKLRKRILDEAGFDFLGRCGDILRDPTFRSSKDGVANRSWHKTGRAFDYDQTSNAIVIVSEPIGGKQYFRTYLKSAWPEPIGSRKRVRDIRGYYINAELVDFTAIAEEMGFRRIPAWRGWQQHYNRREFWHYQYNPANLSWDAAMSEIRNGISEPAKKVLGLSDRGEAVREIQAKLASKNLLPLNEADGVFGPITRRAVIKFQAANGLDPDGLVGPATRAKLFN